MTEEDKERLLVELQKKISSLERRLQGNLSQDEHLQELLQEVGQISISELRPLQGLHMKDSSGTTCY